MSKYNDPRWQQVRLKIMERDGWSCQACGAKHRPLHVHHKSYKGEIWEAKPNQLQTLCEECHKALGEHPEGGVWWNEHGGFACSHCPQCGGNNFRDKGGYDACNDCGCRIKPEAFPCAVGA